MEKKKIKKIIIFSVLGIILAILIALGIRYRNTLRLVFNWDNIVSFVNSKRYTSNEIQKKMENNKKEMETLAKEDPNINIRGDLTAEELQALKDGKITQEEAISIVKGDITLEEILSAKESTPGEEPSQETSGDAQGTDTPQDKPQEKPQQKPQTPPEDRPSQIVAELYVVQADFISRLEQMGDKAYADYVASGYDRENVMTIVDSYSGEVAKLELECDQKVRELLKELESELKKVGGDLSTVQKIRQYYYSEKSLKKTYYLNKLNDEDYK